MDNKKLVSKNSVLKFKLGRKIIKANKGDTIVYNGEEYKDLGNGTMVTRSGRLLSPIRIPTGVRYAETPATRTESISQAAYNREVAAGRNPAYDIVPKWGGMFRTTVAEQNPTYDIIPEWGGMFKSAIEEANNSSEEPPVEEVSTPISERETSIIQKRGISNPATVRRPSAIFLGRGIQKNWRGSRGAIDEESLAGLRELGINATNAREALIALNDYARRNGVNLGKIAVDNAWGDQSKYALNHFLGLKRNQQSNNLLIRTNDFYKPLSEGSVQAVASTLPEKININISRNANYNKSLTRERIRQLGYNPYSDFTGGQRRLLRLYWNGEINELPQELNMFTNTYRQGGLLLSINPIEKFKQGRKILFAQGGTGNLKRFRYASSDGKIVKEFNTKEEAEAYRKKIGKPGVIRDLKGASNGTVVKTNRTNERATAYDRQEAEKPYNNLSLKEAYKKALSSGNLFFGYKGKVYRTDLKNGKDNITDMIKIYGNNLGWDKDPKLLNKSSRTAREEYRKRVESTNNSRPVKPLETNSSVNSKADAYEKATWNGGKGFTDLMMPNNVIMKLGEKAADGLFGTNYSNNKIYRFGLNPFGIAEDAAEGNLGGLALRGLDAYTWLGMPGAGQFVDRLLTAHAPKLLLVSSKSRYIPKGGLENGTLNKWNWNSLAKWGSPATRDSYNIGIRSTVTEGGRRSMQRAANEGVEIGGFKGFDKARQWATNFGQNTNTGTTFFFRGNPTSYDIAADRAVLLTPYIAAPVDVTTQFLNTHPIE